MGPPPNPDTRRWNTVGYPKFSEWMGSDDDFFILKRFDTETARVALWMQDRVAQLSEELQDMDNDYKSKGADCSTFRTNGHDTRMEMLEELATRLKEYHDFILSYSAIKEKAPASGLQTKNMLHWLNNNHGAVAPDETKFIKEERNRRELISVTKKKSPLRRLLNNWRTVLELPWLKEKRSTESTIYSKDSLIDRMVYAIAIVLGLVMLLGPLWLLQSVFTSGTQTETLGIVTAFTVSFSGLFAMVAVAQPFEVLAATAAYAAVLMVYMQIQASGNTGQNC